MGFIRITDCDAYQHVDVVRLVRPHFVNKPKAIWLSERFKCVVFLQSIDIWPTHTQKDSAIIVVHVVGDKVRRRQIDCATDGVVAFVLTELMNLTRVLDGIHGLMDSAIIFSNELVVHKEGSWLVDLPTYRRYKVGQEAYGVH